MKPSALDLKKLLEALSKEEVDYVLVGGMALVVHGGDLATTDFDLALALDEHNTAKAARALNLLHPLLRGVVPVELDSKAFAGEFVGFLTDAGAVDVINRLSVDGGYQGLRERAVRMKLFGLEIQVASLTDLRSLKSRSSRSKDLEHVREIDAIIRMVSPEE